MLAELVDHVIGTDPDRDRVTAAIVASNTTAVIATEEFAATASGYGDLIGWADAHCNGDSRAWSIEGTRSYGAGATLTLEAADEWVIEFDRPTTSASKDPAKTDALDAVRAAREALGRDKLSTPRSSGKRSELQALKVVRDSAQQSRATAIKQLRALLVTGPVELRDQLRHLTLGNSSSERAGCDPPASRRRCARSLVASPAWTKRSRTSTRTSNSSWTRWHLSCSMRSGSATPPPRRRPSALGMLTPIEFEALELTRSR